MLALLRRRKAGSAGTVARWLGGVGFAFFLLKGIAWLAVIALGAGSL